MLRRIPKRCRHLRRETWCAAVGIVSKSTQTLLSCLGVTRMWCYRVLSSHPSTIFLVDQDASPYLRFFVDIGSLQRPSVYTFGLKTLSMLLKRWQIICLLSMGPPWQVEIKSPRQTYTWAKACPCCLGQVSVHYFSSAVVGGRLSGADEWVNSLRG